MGAEILLILLLIALNGALAMSEIALVSVKKTRLRERADRGEAGAAAALQLVEAPTRFLSTVQIGITLVGIFAGAFGGATVAEHLQERLEEISSLAPYAEVLALAVVVLTITYLSLVFGEIVPKRIALNNPESISTLVARPIGLLATLTRPAVARIPATEFHAAGRRIDASPSCPIATVQKFAETAAAEPPEEPPTVRFKS